MKVALLDLKAQFATIRDQVVQAILPILDSQQSVNGPAIKQLEELVADYSGCRAAVGLSSGTDALLVSLMALDIGAGDEVICPPFTFFGTAGSIWRTGAKPVFVDIDSATFNIDPAKIADAITDKTKAIMPVHLYGQMAEMDPIMAVAAEHRLAVIEDAAQSIGAAYKGRKAGSIGAAGCLSFYPTKNLGGVGDGGMVVTNDTDLADKIRALRNHGETSRYHYKYVGGNFRLDTIQAAVLVVKLTYLDGWSAKRRANAARYDALLADCSQIVTPKIAEGNESIFNQYVIRTPKRDGLQAFLADHEIGTGIYYPLCLHQQECFKGLGYNTGDFPVSEKAAAEVLALPIYPELADEQIDFVADKIKTFLQ
ncbi:MAG TPA: DegT/DnrJ/EryC1/StrS family aminotransferase [Phycisphaerae bacterium]|nr:DegT/DnrJ/EryC1/StrS family aminotransferase [Phycisphaerae bacterium]HDZ44381.1 DegT/DnrJ/EryC1/StrS family aminotransferase [Phycisphaerae bacterium]